MDDSGQDSSPDACLLRFMEQYTRNQTEWLKSKGCSTDPLQLPTGLVRKHGELCVPQHLPRKQGFRRGRRKECFNNSLFKSFEHGLIYVEGFALTSLMPIPLHHAWCIDSKRNVFEFTWKQPGLAYFGIPFTAVYLRRCLDQWAGTGTSCLIGFDEHGRLTPMGPVDSWRHALSPLTKDPEK